MSQEKVSQIIVHHSSNRHWSKFIKTGRHIRISKLTKVVDNDPLHVIISEHHLENLTAPITDVSQSLQKSRP